MGATDGVIMPIIITVHIANMNAKCQAVHGMKSGDIMPDMSKPVASQLAQCQRSDEQAMTSQQRANDAASGRASFSR